MSTWRLRPARLADLDQLLALAAAETPSITTFPPDEAFLRRRVAASELAFDPRVTSPGAHDYLFLLEHAPSGRIDGVAGVVSKVGGFEPFLTYELREETAEHSPLALSCAVRTLHLKSAFNGPSEICSLYLHPRVRGAGLGRLLSLGRFLFMGAFPERFEDEIISEMRGVQLDGEGVPFWESLGRHFYRVDFATADRLSGLGGKQFIRDLAPRHPIFVDLLPAAAQEVIGQVHRDTEPARRMLCAEGFRFGNEIDIFDAGPLLRGSLRELRVVCERRHAPITSTLPPNPAATRRYLVSNDRLNFRAAASRVESRAEGVAIDADALEALELSVGDEVCFVTARPDR